MTRPIPTDTSFTIKYRHLSRHLRGTLYRAQQAQLPVALARLTNGVVQTDSILESETASSLDAWLVNSAFAILQAGQTAEIINNSINRSFTLASNYSIIYLFSQNS